MCYYGSWLNDSLLFEFQEKMANLYTTPEFFSSMEPIPGAVEAVKEICNLENTEVFICTVSLRNFDNCLPEKVTIL
ncbi:hypothetical protein NDU88_008397 [Pleurodeles waltl]|uniref:Uncharacterized protein n=1 Tax=Pleurodeles waltl TaxID=8319 RepID=A0AAV7PP16_PLEWA|nr:hypothetical protein NDU88_008397 [Pleurodeles waltl]